MSIRRRLFLLLILFSACDQSMRLPYIEPELRNWPETYQGVSELKLHVFNTGKVQVPNWLLYRGGGFLSSQMLDILVFAIEHPRHGIVLFGTGLNHEIISDPEGYLGAFLTLLGTPIMEDGQDLPTQLKETPLSDETVRFIVLPDLRLDHTGELESFPEATVVVTSVEHTEAINQNGIGFYLEKEYDQVREWQFVDFTGAKPLGTFHAHVDLFDDGSLLLLDVAGATAGSLAVLVRLPTGPVLLCGNLAWTWEHYFYTQMPRFLFDREAWWEKVWRLKKWKDLVPELVVLPDHDWSAVETVATTDIHLHPFSTEAESEE